MIFIVEYCWQSRWQKLTIAVGDHSVKRNALLVAALKLVGTTDRIRASKLLTFITAIRAVKKAITFLSSLNALAVGTAE